MYVYVHIYYIQYIESWEAKSLHGQKHLKRCINIGELEVSVNPPKLLLSLGAIMNGPKSLRPVCSLHAKIELFHHSPSRRDHSKFQCMTLDLQGGSQNKL